MHALAVWLVASPGLGGCAATGPSSAASEGPEAPAYASAAEEALDLPSRMTAQVIWASEPVDNVALIANDLAQLSAKLQLDPAQFESLCTAVFSGAELDVSMIQPELQAEARATFDKLRTIGVELQGLPNRVQAATTNLAKLAVKAPVLATKAGRELQAKLQSASPAELVQIRADIELVTGLPGQVKAQVPVLKDQILGLPERAKQSVEALTGVFAGKPPPPLPEHLLDQAREQGIAAATEQGPALLGWSPAELVTFAPSSILVGLPPTRALRRPTLSEVAHARQLAVAAEIAAQRGDPWSAAEAWEQAYRRNPSDHELALAIARAARESGDCESAKAYARQYLAIAETEAVAPAHVTDARAVLDAACAEPSQAAVQARALTLRARGDRFSAQSDLLAASAAYAAAFQLAPDQADYAWLAASAAASVGDCVGAQTYAAHYLARSADSKDAKARTANAKALAEGPAGGACAPVLDSDRTRYAANSAAAAEADLEAGLLFDARARARAASDRDSTSKDIHLALARAAWMLGDCEGLELGFSRARAAGWTPTPASSGWADATSATLAEHGCPMVFWLGREESPTAPAPVPAPAPAPAPIDLPPTPATSEGQGGRRLILVGSMTLAAGIAAGGSLVGVGVWGIIAANTTITQAQTPREQELGFYNQATATTNVYVGAAVIGAGLIAGTTMIVVGKKRRASGLAFAPVLAPTFAGANASVRF